jgi:hypothetical protein
VSYPIISGATGTLEVSMRGTASPRALVASAHARIWVSVVNVAVITGHDPCCEGENHLPGLQARWCPGWLLTCWCPGLRGGRGGC